MRNYKVKPIGSLARGFQVLKALQEMRAASLHDLHQVTSIPKSTLTRILVTANREGLVWQRLADGAFLPSHTLQRQRDVDGAAWLVEIASPVLEGLARRTSWPSVLSIPRLDYMEVLETNSRRTPFDDVRFGPTPFRANMLRSASGRAYLAFCPPAELEAVLRRLRDRPIPGHELSHDPAGIARIVRSTRTRGYSTRAPDFGGHYSAMRSEVDDGRESIAMPIIVDGRPVACVNLTWRRSVMTVAHAVERHLEDLRGAVREIERRAEAVGDTFPD